MHEIRTFTEMSIGYEYDVVNYSGTDRDLNHILSTFVDAEDEIKTFCDSRYVSIVNIKKCLGKSKEEFVILTLNIQSINAKFDQLSAVINNISDSGLYFGAIWLRESWLKDDTDLSPFKLSGYQLIHQSYKCTKHGGLIIYFSNKYFFKARNLYSRSDIWEGLFIDVMGYNLRRSLTIGNIYRRIFRFDVH